MACANAVQLPCSNFGRHFIRSLGTARDERGLGGCHAALPKVSKVDYHQSYRTASPNEKNFVGALEWTQPLFLLGPPSRAPVQRSEMRRRRRRGVRVQLATSDSSQTVKEKGKASCGAELVGSLERFPDVRLQELPQPSTTPLLFLDHIQYQWRTLQQNAPDLVDLPIPPDIALQTSAKGKCGARVENWAFRSDTMRRIRMTYFYSGDGGQAYNCLVYPDTRFDVPLLGVDLICLGKDRILYVIDFQPLSMADDYLEKYTSILAPIHAQYEDLIGHMSAKHFDEARFFSKRMLFVRTADVDLFQAPNGRLFRALTEYLAAYHAVLAAAVPNPSADARRAVQAAQDAYDVYSEKRDPAIGLFRSYFGNEWAESFTKDFLFPGCKTGG